MHREAQRDLPLASVAAVILCQGAEVLRPRTTGRLGPCCAAPPSWVLPSPGGESKKPTGPAAPSYMLWLLLTLRFRGLDAAAGRFELTTLLVPRHVRPHAPPRPAGACGLCAGCLCPWVHAHLAHRTAHICKAISVVQGNYIFTTTRPLGRR